MEKPTLYIIQGFIGSGKSTFSKKLAGETGAIILNPDDYVVSNFSREEYMKNWEECFNNALDKLWLKAKSLLQENRSVVFDMGFWKKADRDLARNIARKLNVKFLHYYLEVPDDILKQRIINSRPKEWADLHIKNFENNKLNFEKPTKEENVIIIKNY